MLCHVDVCSKCLVRARKSSREEWRHLEKGEIEIVRVLQCLQNAAVMEICTMTSVFHSHKSFSLGIHLGSHRLSSAECRGQFDHDAQVTAQFEFTEFTTALSLVAIF